jgi:hypothetical protein
MEASIPEEVRRFIATHITSLEQLEVLLLVSALPDREWSAEAVYQVVKTNPALVAQRLEEFSQRGLMTRAGEPPLYRYAPNSDDVARPIATLASFYKMSRHKVVELIYSPGRDQAREFSQAFRFKRED